VNNKQNLLYKSGQAGKRQKSVIKRGEQKKLERKMFKTQNVHMYILLKDCVTCHMTDSSSRQRERPMTNKTATVLFTAKILSLVPEGQDAKTD
jgi:UDP-N-acetylglucosamine 2-epimerase